MEINVQIVITEESVDWQFISFPFNVSKLQLTLRSLLDWLIELSTPIFLLCRIFETDEKP